MELCACGCGQPRPRSGLLAFKKGHRKNAPVAEAKPCACGCGAHVEPKPHHRYKVARYIAGHHRIGRLFPRLAPKLTEIPNGICGCGCGERTPLAKVTCRRDNVWRGHPLRFIPRHRRKKWNLGPGRMNKDGYVMIWAPPDHPNRQKCGGLLEHRYVMERRLGRYLIADETVHHKNGVRSDNRDDNLELWTKSQPNGQRVEDKVAWAKELLALYEPTALAGADCHRLANAEA